MKCVFTILNLFFYTLAFTQMSGKVTYEEKMDLHRNLPPERQEMKDMIPQYNTAVFEFYFQDKESIYQPKKTDETVVNSSSGNSQMSMRFGRDTRVVYKNMETDVMIDSRDFMQKQFLITGLPTVRKWKIGTKQKEILGHKCMEANFRVDSATTLVAWFAPGISNSNGPADYQGLPGLILQVDISEGLRTITATEIKMEQVDPSIIEAPTKGKEVTAEEFEAIRKEKLKEMQLQQGGGPGHQMIMIRN